MTLSALEVRPEKLRHRAELQKLEEVPDGSGGWETTWVKEKDIWCWIRPTSGSQRLESMRRDSEVSHEIFARFETGISTDHRIAYKSKVYRLEAVWSPDVREEYLQAVAVQGVAT